MAISQDGTYGGMLVGYSRINALVLPVICLTSKIIIVVIIAGYGMITTQ
jgi:hypothetical protein